MEAIKFRVVQNLSVVFILIAVAGCDDLFNKDNDHHHSANTPSEASLIVNDADFTTSTYDEISKEALEVAGFSIPYLKSASNNYCRTITFTPSDSVYPRTITIDYGTSGCMNRRGVVKTGKIIVNLSAAPTDSLSEITISLDSLTINGYKIEGTKILRYLGKINGQPTWTSTVTGGKITAANGHFITYEVRNWTRTQIAGISTANFWDNVYSLSGVSLETANRDTSITSYRDSISVQNPLIVAAACRFPQGGAMNITLTKNDSTIRNILVDYGVYTPDTTICKHNATVTVNGKVVSSYAFKE